MSNWTQEREAAVGTEGRFAGKVAIVTGSSRGIGLAAAQAIVDGGGRVCLTGRSAEPLVEAVAALGEERAIWANGSADDEAHQAATVDAVLERFGRLNVLINNTGVNPSFNRIDDIDTDVARGILTTNVVAAIGWTQRAIAAGLGAAGGGAIVNVASVAGLKPAGRIGVYGASKAALLHLTQQLAFELAPHVRVNAVAPAVVRTRFAAPLFKGQDEEVTAGYPMGRLGEPEDVAEAIAFLASEASAWITGQALVVDGGLTLTGGV